MKKPTALYSYFLLGALIGCLGVLTGFGQTLIPRGSSWSYLDNGTDQGTAWVQPGFDDSSWAVGQAQLGYGQGDEVTVVSYGPDPNNKYITTYFRRHFTATNIWIYYTNLWMRLAVDDGAVVYVNGTEIARQNMPLGTISYSTLASSAATNGNIFVPTRVLASLVEGDNVIAVEVHQNAPVSSDLSFDLELYVPLALPMIVTQPQNQKVMVGSDATFSVLASGSELNYQWRFNAANIAGATNDTLTIYNAQITNAGPYQVVVSNSGGSINSSSAMLAVVTSTNPQPPVVTLTAPTNGAVITANALVSLAATASDPDGWVTKVEFYVMTNRVGVDTSAPYSAPWTASPLGSNVVLTAVATDDEGYVTVSDPVYVTIVPPPARPIIITQPQSQKVMVGSDVTFSVVASGNGLRYQWRFNNLSVLGATNSTLTLLNVQTNNAGTYAVTVINTGGSVSSSNAMLAVLTSTNLQPPVVTMTSPANNTSYNPPVTVMMAATAFDADGWITKVEFYAGTNRLGTDSTSPYSYSWYATLAGDYQLTAVATDDNGFRSTSAPVNITLVGATPPRITVQPQDQVVMQGTNVTIQCVATGSTPLSYYWYFNGLPFIPPTNTMPVTNGILILNVQPNNAGTYWCSISNNYGRVTSSNAVLCVMTTTNPEPPLVSMTSPADGAVYVYPPTAPLEAAASDPNGCITKVEFFVNGASVGVKTAPPYRMYWTSSYGPYQAFAAATDNDGNTTVSAPVTFTLGPLPAPTILEQPQSQIALTGSVVTFSCVATGAPPLTYTWFYNDGPYPILVSSNSSLTLFDVQTSNSGTYQVQVGNANGMAISTPARLCVVTTTNPEPPTVTMTSPANGAVLTDPYAITLSADASDPNGCVLYVYFMIDDLGVGESGIPPYSLTISPPPNGTHQASAMVLDEDGYFIMSDPVTFTVATMQPPTIVTQPQDQTVMVGSNVTFTVEATGTPPLFYNWFFNNSPVGVTTNGILTLMNVQANQAGSYMVAVSNYMGSAISSSAVLTVINPNLPPMIIASPQSQTVAVGSTATFSCIATGSPPLTFRWYFNGVEYPSASDSVLTIPNVQTNNAGTYYVEVSNPYGSATSAGAVLTVAIPGGGTLNFNNRNSVYGINAPIRYETNGPAPGGLINGAISIPEGAYVWGGINARAALYAGPVGCSENELTLLVPAVNFRTGLTAGYVNVGAAAMRVVPNVPLGSNAVAQVRAWDAGIPGVDSYEDALALSQTRRVYLGKSPLFQTPPLGGGMIPPTPLVGLQGFSLTYYPMPPSIVTQPQDQTVMVGSNAIFTVEATGTGPLLYTWYFNGVQLWNSTNGVLALMNVQTNQAGLYSVFVSNNVGSVLSTTARLTVLIPNRPPVAHSQELSFPEDSSMAITLTASDPDGDSLTFRVVTNCLHGTLSGTAPELVYTPNPNFFGLDSFVFVANDGEYDSWPTVIWLQVTAVNDLPVPIASAGPVLHFLTEGGRYVILSTNNTSALVTFDGSSSYDIDSQGLEYSWSEPGASNAFASGVTVTVPLNVGGYSIYLTVSDGLAASSTAFDVNVISLCQALDGIANLWAGSSLADDVQRELLATLQTACQAFGRNRFAQGLNHLREFQGQVTEVVQPVDAALAEKLNNATQEIINAVSGGIRLGAK